MCNDITRRPAQHVADFVKAHRERAFQRRDDRLVRVGTVGRTHAAAEGRHVRQRDEELDALRSRRQRRDAVRTVLAKRRVDLHEQVEERRRNLLQRSVETTIQ